MCYVECVAAVKVTTLIEFSILTLCEFENIISKKLLRSNLIKYIFNLFLVIFRATSCSFENAAVDFGRKFAGGFEF